MSADLVHPSPPADDSPADVTILDRRPPEEQRLLLVEHYIKHWWREPLAGALAIGIACWDTWHFGHNDGFNTSLDELLLLTGLALIAGIRNLFPSSTKVEKVEEKK